MIPNILILQKEKRRDGQALVEAIVALSVLMVGFVAMLSLLNNSLATTNMVSDQDIATYLAAEGIEVVKNLVGANILASSTFDNNFQQGSYEVEANQKLEPDPIDTDNDNPGKRIGAWNDYSNTYLNFDSLTNSYTYISGTPARFKRTIQVVPPMGNRLRIVSIIRWDTKGGGTSEVKLEDFFFPQ